MSHIIFPAFESVQVGVNDGDPLQLTVRVSSTQVRTPTYNRKDTISLEGTSGVTRIRNKYYVNQIIVPFIRQAELPMWQDFANSAGRGFLSPFIVHTGDILGNVNDVNAILTDPQVLIDILNCISAASRINYREIN